MHCVRCPDVLPPEVSKVDEGAPAARATSGWKFGGARVRATSCSACGRCPASLSKLGGLLLKLSDDPQSTKNWKRGALGEGAWRGELEKELADRAVVLDDRRLGTSRANIDYIVVGPAGVFTVDTKHWKGKVERRQVGPVFERRFGLFVGGRDRSASVDGVGAQTQAVRKALVDDPVPVRAVLCFTGDNWPMLPRPFVISGVWIGWPRALVTGALMPSQPRCSISRRSNRSPNASIERFHQPDQ